jgi:cation:H+ antiporter
MTAAIKPLETGGIVMSDLYVMIAMTVVLFAMMWTGKRITRWEGGILLAGYAGYCIFLWFDRVAVAA